MKLLRNITLGASFLLANQACTSVNQITSETSDQTYKQLELELDSNETDPLRDFIDELTSAGFEINSFQQFINPKHAHFNGATRQEADEARSKFLHLPQSGFMLVSKSSLNTEAKLRELLEISDQSRC